MATVTLPTYTVTGLVTKDYEIDQLSFARSIVRQGKGARKAWRDQFSYSRFELIPQSHEALNWNKRFQGCARVSMHGIRAGYRAYEKFRDLERLRNQLRGDPWAMIDTPTSPAEDPDHHAERYSPQLFTDEQAAPGSDDI